MSDKYKLVPTRDDLIQCLLATRGQSEGVTADAILSMLYTTPQPAPNVQGEPVAVADALRQIAGWMDDGGPTYHEAELIGMAISGPVECSSAKQCTKAAKKAFLEAARIWEYMHQSQPAEQQPVLTEALRQYRNNDGSGLVFGYDKLLVDRHVAWLVEALECALETMENVDGANDCSRGIDAVEEALAAHRNQGGGS